MPVLPEVASTIVVVPGSIRPSASAASIIAIADAVLDRAALVEGLELPVQPTPSGPCGVMPDHRRVADVIGDVGRNSPHCRGRGYRCHPSARGGPGVEPRKGCVRGRQRRRADVAPTCRAGDPTERRIVLWQRIGRSAIARSLGPDARSSRRHRIGVHRTHGAGVAPDEIELGWSWIAHGNGFSFFGPDLITRATVRPARRPRPGQSV